MSMLAEPRRKQRIPIDPQNVQWGNDEGGFGRKLMMEQMGWKNGGGLGKNGNGIRENIRLKANYAQKGFGAQKSGSNNDGAWVAHHQNFAQLLAELNEKKAAGKKEKEEPAEVEPEKSTNNLELPPNSIEAQRSLKSRKIQYHRYVHSKDVCGYSAKQKAAIFGNSLKTADNDATEDDNSSILAVREKSIQQHEVDSEEEPAMRREQNGRNEERKNIKTASITMDQYFAQKMAEIATRKVANMGEEGKLAKGKKGKRKGQEDNIEFEIAEEWGINVEAEEIKRGKMKKRKKINEGSVGSSNDLDERKR